MSTGQASSTSNSLGVILVRPTLADAHTISRVIGDTWSRFFAYSVTDSDLAEYLDGPLSAETIAKDIQNREMRFLVAVIPPADPADAATGSSTSGGDLLSPTTPSHGESIARAQIVPSVRPRSGSRSGSRSRSRSRSMSAQPGSTPGEIIAVAQLVLHTTEPCLTLPRPIELRRLYVAPDHHSSGVATMLMRGVEELARDEGYASLWLGVWEDNARGKRFYEKMGFVTRGEHVFLVGESRRRDWVMEKPL